MEESTYSQLQHDSKHTATPVADNETRSGYGSLGMPVREHTEPGGKGQAKPSMEYSVVRREDGKKVSLHIQAKK